jgi:homopolymeric O-antigen transport system ATP-binding protein
VGDEYFQKKCIDRMMNFKGHKTILFCSHSLYSVQELCSHAMWIHKGRINSLGKTSTVIADYHNHERRKIAAHKEKVSDIEENSGNTNGKPVTITDVKIMDKNGEETVMLKTLEPAIISFRIRCNGKSVKGHIAFGIERNDREVIFGTNTNYDGFQPISFEDGQIFKIRLKNMPVLFGKYNIVIIAGDEHALHSYDFSKSSTFSILNDRKELGMTYIEHEWII